MQNQTNTKRSFTLLPCFAAEVISAIVLGVTSRAGALFLSAVFIALISASFAVQILSSKNYLYILIATICICAVFLIAGELSTALCAIVLFIAALLSGGIIAFLIKKNASKMSVTLACAALYGVVFVSLFLASLAINEAAFSFGGILEYFDSLFAAFKEAFLDSARATDLWSTYAPYGLTEEDFILYLDELILLVKLLLPGIFISAFAVLGYITASLFKGMTRLSHTELLLPDPRWESAPSVISAFVYIIAYGIYALISIFTIGSTGITGLEVICLNIVIIFYPLMVLMGLKWFFGKKRSGIILAIFIGAAIIFMQYLLSILALIGAWHIFRRHEQKKPNGKKNKHNDFQ